MSTQPNGFACVESPSLILSFSRSPSIGVTGRTPHRYSTLSALIYNNKNRASLKIPTLSVWSFFFSVFGIIECYTNTNKSSSRKGGSGIVMGKLWRLLNKKWNTPQTASATADAWREHMGCRYISLDEWTVSPPPSFTSVCYTLEGIKTERKQTMGKVSFFVVAFCLRNKNKSDDLGLGNLSGIKVFSYQQLYPQCSWGESNLLILELKLIFLRTAQSHSTN